MRISKFFCMLIAGLAIIGFTTVCMAEESKTEATESITGEGEVAVKAEATEEVAAEEKAEATEEVAAEEEGEKEAKAE